MADRDSYTVVARRYRPQQFAELVGQEAVAAGLSQAIRTGRVAHAYLFTGGRGMGKTTTARILAKALNCERGPTPTPCDKCDNCLRIMTGDDVDTIEIDAATNTQVDHVRDLKANAGFRPLKSRYKIYIIDEVHMLSSGSFNALLKTLEEPPPHVKFVLATTELRKIPETILSRCQRFDFAAISADKVFASLKQVVARENTEAEDAALMMIARRANGSMRDAQTLLEQTLSATDGPLTVARLHAVLGTAAEERVVSLAEAILAQDPKETLAELLAALEGGVQPNDLLDQLIDYWRGLMLVAVAGADVSDLPGGVIVRESVQTQAATRTLDTILAGIDILTNTREKSRFRGSHGQVMLEVAAIRLARLEEILPVASLVQLLRSQGPPPGGGGASPPPPPGKPVARAAQPVAPPEAEAGAGKKSPAPPVIGPVAQVPNPQGATTVEITPENVTAIWEETLSHLGRLRQDAFRVAGLPAIIGPNALAIRLPGDYSSYSLCASDATLEAVRKVLRKLTGRDCLLKVEPLPTGQAVTPMTGSRPVPPPAGTLDKDLMRLPLFLKAAETLGAQLVRVEEGFNPHLVTTVADADAELAIPE